MSNEIEKKNTEAEKEANPLMEEFMEIMLEEFMPKIKKFMPRILTMIENDNTILKEDEIAVLSKNSQGKLIFVVTKKTNFSMLVDPREDKESRIYSFNNLMNQAINQVLNKKTKNID